MDHKDPRLVGLRRFANEADLSSLEMTDEQARVLSRSIMALNILVDGVEQCDMAFNRGFSDALGCGSDVLTAVQSGKIELARHMQYFLHLAVSVVS